jgi:hypothetical protein
MSVPQRVNLRFLLIHLKLEDRYHRRESLRKFPRTQIFFLASVTNGIVCVMVDRMRYQLHRTQHKKTETKQVIYVIFNNAERE